MLIIILFVIYACQGTPNNNFLTVPNSKNDQVEVFPLDDVEYLFFGYQVTFDEAHIICLNYKGQLAVLNSKEKAEFVTKTMSNTLELGEFWIGAQSNKNDLWYWIDRNKKLKLDHTFLGRLRLWDSSELVSSNDNCLTIYRKRHNIPTFVPIQCSKKRPFICEREIDKFSIEAKEVDVIKVDNEEFTLYLAKATWAEAVVHCRRKNLQIAEIKSKKTARAIATSMLRVRPDAMENAWIGGHLKDNMWEWVASNNNIIVNELWTNNSLISSGCLLLDRHVCEEPIYVSAQCNRKRHILCQKPAKKIISKLPIPIQVNGCPYWIGVYPLQWIEARKSCLDINASLVILNSSRIINHMMNLMSDYKQELRHIWTDGYRRKDSFNLKKETDHGTWYWASTGSEIPNENFIPWCPVYYDAENENCLNLDRENHKTPVVYGLNCRKNQTYVCQPWNGKCVSHQVQEDLLKNSDFLNLYSSLADTKPIKTPTIALSQNSSTEENVSYLYEDMSNVKNFHSTESYYTSSVSFSTQQQVTFLLEQTTRPIEIAFRNSAIFEGDSQDSDYEKEPEIKSTEFGIRVVSAEETSPKSQVSNFSQNIKSQEFPKLTIKQSSKHKNKKISLPNLNRSHVPMTNEFQKIKPKNRISLPNLNKSHVPMTTELRNENTVSTFGYLSSTEKIRENVDNSRVEMIEKKDQVLKSSDGGINVEESKPHNLNISAILQKVIEEELQLLNQQKSQLPVLEKEVYFESTIDPHIEFENIEIPPYVAPEGPLSVEFSNDEDVPMTPVSPSFRFFDEVDNSEMTSEEPEEPRIDANDNFDFDSLDPYDPKSMLKLGRFLKSMFADQGKNPQTINFNLVSGQNLPTMETNETWIEKNYIQRDTRAQTKNHNEMVYSTDKNLILSPCQSVQSSDNEQPPCNQAPVLVPFVQLFGAPNLYSDTRLSSGNENENEEKNVDDIKNTSVKKSTNENGDRNGNINQRSVNGKFANSQKSLFKIFKYLVKGVRIDIKETQLRNYVRRFVREKFPNPGKYEFDAKSGWHKTLKKILDLLNGVVIRFHGERVRLRVGSFGYKRNERIKSIRQNHKKKSSSRERFINHSRGEKLLKFSKKVVKKSINEETPFPDFSVIDVNPKRVEDSIESGLETIRVSRAVKNDKVELVSVYIILKENNDEFASNDSLPILELHIRMPAGSNPDKESSGYKTRSVNNLVSNQISGSSQYKNVPKYQTEERKKKLKNTKLENVNGERNDSVNNYEKANDFIRNIINNVTNFRTIPDLKRKRQLLYLALQYLKHVTDEKQKKKFKLSKNDDSSFGDKNKEIMRNWRNLNLRIPQMQNVGQRMIYPGMEKTPLNFNMAENDLNPGSRGYNSFPNFNYNTKRYDNVQYLPVHSRMRRNLKLFRNSKFKKFSNNYQELKKID